jgi:CheY-like chemotaxis protein
VILLSASTARGDIARRLQVEATLGKPFFAEDLRDLVSSLTRDREAVAAS